MLGAISNVILFRLVKSPSSHGRNSRWNLLGTLAAASHFEMRRVFAACVDLAFGFAVYRGGGAAGRQETDAYGFHVVGQFAGFFQYGGGYIEGSTE